MQISQLTGLSTPLKSSRDLELRWKISSETANNFASVLSRVLFCFLKCHVIFFPPCNHKLFFANCIKACNCYVRKLEIVQWRMKTLEWSQTSLMDYACFTPCTNYARQISCRLWKKACKNITNFQSPSVVGQLISSADKNLICSSVCQWLEHFRNVQWG